MLGAQLAIFPAKPGDVTGAILARDGVTPGANGSTIVSWDWNFGNNTFGTGVRPPAVVYNLDRAFTVTLTVTDDRGQTGSVSRTVTVTVP